VHLQPTPSAVPLDHNGWSPVHAHPHDLAPAQPENHFLDPNHFTQEQGTQVFEQHTNDQQYHDYQDQLQHHIQQQLDQEQYDQHLNHHQHQPNSEYGAPQQEYGQPNDFVQNQDFAQHAHEYSHHVQEYAQHGHEYPQNEYSAHQPAQEYGLPGAQEYVQPGIEGRSGEGDEDSTQRYHNHIPLGLQPPIDRPLEHFQ
jgi:hypothetical protein